MYRYEKNHRNGMGTLLVILIIGAVMLIIATRLALTGIDETNSTLIATKSLEITGAADGCLDEALAKLSGNPFYSGEALIIGQASCTVEVAGSGDRRTIRVTAMQEGILARVIEADIDMNTMPPTLTAWREKEN